MHIEDSEDLKPLPVEALVLVAQKKKRMAYFYTSCKKLSYSQLLSLHYWVRRLPEFEEYSVVEEEAVCQPWLPISVYFLLERVTRQKKVITWCLGTTSA